MSDPTNDPKTDTPRIPAARPFHGSTAVHSLRSPGRIAEVAGPPRPTAYIEEVTGEQKLNVVQDSNGANMVLYTDGSFRHGKQRRNFVSPTDGTVLSGRQLRRQRKLVNRLLKAARAAQPQQLVEVPNPTTGE
jgi:hypothetical protein